MSRVNRVSACTHTHTHTHPLACRFPSTSINHLLPFFTATPPSVELLFPSSFLPSLLTHSSATCLLLCASTFSATLSTLFSTASLRLRRPALCMFSACVFVWERYIYSLRAAAGLQTFPGSLRSSQPRPTHSSLLLPTRGVLFSLPLYSSWQ